MKRGIAARAAGVCAVALAAAALIAPATPAGAQVNLQEKIAEAQQLVLVNKQQLARYTWQSQETVSVNGDVKDETIYQVAVGPTGQQTKQVVAQPVAPSSDPRKHGIKHRMEDRMKAYAQAVGDLVKSYAAVDTAHVKDLAAQGFVSVRAGGAPGFVAIVIDNYVKSGDAVTLTFSENPKQLVAVTVATYNDGPGDPVSIQVRYGSLPDGTRFPATTTVNAPANGLMVVDQNMNFTPR